MKLTRVTITGADDGVDPGELVRLSAEFPFVEWGILFSRSRQGDPRYPSWRWLLDLTCRCRPPVALAAHLCGHFARTLLVGEDDWPDEFKGNIADAFARIQLNGISPERPPSLVATVLNRTPGVEYVLQSSPRTLPYAALISVLAENVSSLWDESGGRGIALGAAPPLFPGLRQGYAGGITPDNVVEVISMLRATPGGDPFWIDMESGVRTDDRFDLQKVREVLTKARPFVEASS